MCIVFDLTQYLHTGNIDGLYYKIQAVVILRSAPNEANNENQV